tara:strand:+ start:2687 stop:2842 length:156 start_codon:yes stop_codon:yes gene_type:complete
MKKVIIIITLSTFAVRNNYPNLNNSANSNILEKKGENKIVLQKNTFINKKI